MAEESDFHPYRIAPVGVPKQPDGDAFLPATRPLELPPVLLASPPRGSLPGFVNREPTTGARREHFFIAANHHEKVDYLMQCRYKEEKKKFERAKELLMDEARRQHVPSPDFGAQYISMNFPNYATWRLRVIADYM